MMQTFDYDMDSSTIPNLTKIFLNGNWIGFSNNPEELVNLLRNSRRNGDLPVGVSILRDISNKEIKYFIFYNVSQHN
jgi:hypothetical protein